MTQIPEYPRWFVPCVKKWLQQFQRKAVEFVDNAWEDDKVTFGVRELEIIIVSATGIISLSSLSLFLVCTTRAAEVHLLHISDFLLSQSSKL